MNILILTYGSRGDVQPYVALGNKLQDAGHKVTLGTSVRFQDFVESHGLDYAYMNDDLLSIIDTDDGKDLLEKGSTLYEMITRGFKMMEKVKPANKALLKESWQAAQATTPNFILFHPKAPGAIHIAEKLNIGCALVTPIPMFVPTSEFRFPIFPNLPFGGWYNRMTYQLIKSMTNIVLKSYVHDFRKELDLPPIKKYDSIRKADGSNVPILHIHSETVVQRPVDWPDHAHVTGYCFLDKNERWTPPENLVNFLEAGPAPVYIGFGSMAGRAPERLAKIVVKALQETGMRGIIATGWGGLEANELPETILKIDQAPHDWLFPKMSAIVHHGGAGTTAASLRAGKPTIIVPFFGDQPFWGQVVHQIGAGTPPIAQKNFNALSLAIAMQEVTKNQTIIDTASEIGQKIRQEDGLSKAVNLIEDYALKM